MTQFGPSGFALRAMQLGLLAQPPGETQPPSTIPTITPGFDGQKPNPAIVTQTGGGAQTGGLTPGLSEDQVTIARLQEELARSQQAPPKPTPEVMQRVGQLGQQITGEESRLRGNLFPGLDPGKAFEEMARAGKGQRWKPPPDWQRTMAMSTPMQSFVQPNTIQGIVGMRRERERLTRPYIG